MIRNLLYVLVLLVIVQLMPQNVMAQETNAGFCALDGYISSTVTPDIHLIESPDQPLVLNFSVNNGSSVYSYGAVDVGIALYVNETATVPVFWTPVAYDLEISPLGEQRFETEIDMNHVPAGEYIVRIGVAQGGQLSALASSFNSESIPIKKTVSGSVYKTVLTDISNKELVSPGEFVSYNLTTENNSGLVKRDYDQHLVIVRGDTPRGSAIISSLSEPVKMIPGSSESTNITALITTEGEYMALGYSTEENVLLPVVTERFVIGQETGPTDSYIAAIGVSGLDDMDTTEVQVMSCISSVTGDAFDVMQVEQQIVVGKISLDSTIADISNSGYVMTKISKENLAEFVVNVNLFTGAIPSDSDIDNGRTTNDAPSLGLLKETITQKLVCGDGCQAPSITETLGAFAAEETVQSTFWFYLGIILASLLLLFLMLGRLAPPEEENEPMHEPQ